jgi:predicted SAM-dependent methyltransferase
MEKEIKLNLGCGNNYLAGYVNIDVVKSFVADKYHDLSKPLPYQNESVSRILAKDILEHFSKYEISTVLKDWIRVLKIGCDLELIVPNIEAIRAFSGETLLNLIYGEQMFGGVNTGYYGLHKWGFTLDSLKSILTEYGMEIKLIEPCDGTNIHCISTKVKGLW